jgi:chromosome segregation ATPase
MSHEMERLRHENAILRYGTLQSSDKDLELQVAYHYLSEAEHELNYARQQLDLTREEVDTRTHVIVHLENAIETQDAKLEERAETIANLEQHLLELQL